MKRLIWRFVERVAVVWAIVVAIGFLGYLTQVGVVISWRILPLAETESEGCRYTLRRGHGSSFEFFPLLGVAGMFQPASVEVENLETGAVDRKEYDFVSEAIVLNQAIFPEEYRKLKE